MGKYDSVIDRLAPLPETNPGWQERIDEEKARLNEGVRHTPESLAHMYGSWRLKKDEIEDQLKPVNLRLAALEQLIAESHNDDAPGWGLYGASENTIRLASGAEVQIQYTPTARIEDPDVFRAWCLASAYGNQMRLMPQTLDTLVKERLLAGVPEPPGTKAFVRTTVKWKRA